MTQMDLFQSATSSQQDTPASPFHLPGSEEAQKMTDISGHTFFPLLKQSDPLGAFSRMFMVTSPWASTRCCLTWKAKATPQGRLLFQLAASTLPTDETGSGLSPDIVGNSEHDGSLATEIGRINEEDARRSQEGSEITEQSSGASRSGHDETLSRPNNVAYSVSTRLQRGAQSGNACGSRAQRNEQSSRRSKLTDGQNWLVEPNVGRVAHGIPRRVDRLKGLGNAIVPQIAMNIGLAIKEQEDV